MSKKVAIIQSSFFPWRGYFDIINQVDEFIFLDSVQYTSRDWRNRNKIKLNNGKSKWFTAPVDGGRKPINKVTFIGKEWKKTHLETIYHSYNKAPFFNTIWSIIQDIYSFDTEYLSAFNINSITQLSRHMGINTNFHLDTDLQLTSIYKKTRLLEIINKVNGNIYINGPKGRNYLGKDEFKEQGIMIKFYDYPSYPSYPQLHGAYISNISILDLLFNIGIKNALKYI